MLSGFPCGLAGVGAESEAARRRAPDEPAPAKAASTLNQDAALERVLRSGCHDGLPAVRALTDDSQAPWAATVLRLCGDILRREREPSASMTLTEEGLSAKRDLRPVIQEGRGWLVYRGDIHAAGWP